MSTSDEKRWEQLFASIQDLTSKVSSSHSDLGDRLQSTNSLLETMREKIDINEGKLAVMENREARYDKSQRARNIILYRLEDSDDINKHLIGSIRNIFTELNLDIPDLAIADAFRLGKSNNDRPVLIKFIAERWVKHAFTKVREFGNLNLAISNDRTPEEREKRRQLLSTRKTRSTPLTEDQNKQSNIKHTEEVPTGPQETGQQQSNLIQTNVNDNNLRGSSQKRKLLANQLNSPKKIKNGPGRPPKLQMGDKDTHNTNLMKKFLSSKALNSPLSEPQTELDTSDKDPGTSGAQ